MQEESIRSIDEMVLLCSKVVQDLERVSFSEKEAFSIRLALEESIANSIKHGHREDPAKTVHVRYAVREDEFEVEIEDEGPGFDPNGVPDPLAAENLEKPSGRGIFLMRHYMDAVEFNDSGTRVRMRKAKG